MNSMASTKCHLDFFFQGLSATYFSVNGSGQSYRTKSITCIYSHKQTVMDEMVTADWRRRRQLDVAGCRGGGVLIEQRYIFYTGY